MGAEDDDDTTSGSPKTVPYERFQAVTQARNELRTKNVELERQVQQLTEKAATADTLAGQLETVKGDLAAKAAAWDEERGLLQSGLTDPDDIDLAKLFHGKTPKEGRKPLGEWWQALKADPTKAPRQLQPLLGGGNHAETKAGGEAAGKASGGGSGNASTTAANKAGGAAAGGDPASAEKIREVVARAKASGDWTEYKALRAQVG